MREFLETRITSERIEIWLESQQGGNRRTLSLARVEWCGSKKAAVTIVRGL
jgi:hypothetical protein